MKIKHRLSIFIIVSGLSVNVLGWAFVQKSYDLYEKLIYHETADKFYLFSQRIEEKLKEVDKLSLNIMTDAEVQSSLLTISQMQGTFESFNAANRISKKLTTYQLFNTNSLPQIVITDTQFNFHSSPGVYPESFGIDKLKSLQEAAEKSEGASQWIGGTKGENFFISVRAIRELRKLNLTTLGNVAIQVPAEQVLYAADTGNRGFGSSLIIRDNKGLTIYNNLEGEDIPPFSLENANDGKGKQYEVVVLNNEKFLASSFKMEYTDWTFTHLVSYNAVFASVRVARITQLSVYLLLLIALLWLGLQFSHSITRPLELLTRKMAYVERGEFVLDYSEVKNPQDEIALLERDFNSMAKRLNTLINENYVKQMQLKEAEYEMLKAKLNPHFLYNTLDSINWLARSNGQSAISGMVKALGDLLRATIDSKAFVSLGEELVNLEKYIWIQKFRFEERLSYVVEIPTDLLGLQIPGMMLQPIVENCIKYGVDAETGRCEITISARKEADKLYILTEDKGAGISLNSKISKIDSSDNQQSSEGGIGLHSIGERIKLLYGEDYGISLAGGETQGTIVCLTFPVIRSVIDKGGSNDESI